MHTDRALICSIIEGRLNLLLEELDEAIQAHDGDPSNLRAAVLPELQERKHLYWGFPSATITPIGSMIRPFLRKQR